MEGFWWATNIYDLPISYSSFSLPLPSLLYQYHHSLLSLKRYNFCLENPCILENCFFFCFLLTKRNILILILLMTIKISYLSIVRINFTISEGRIDRRHLRIHLSKLLSRRVGRVGERFRHSFSFCPQPIAIREETTNQFTRRVTMQKK